jgi:hypothetical protein
MEGRCDGVPVVSVSMIISITPAVVSACNSSKQCVKTKKREAGSSDNRVTIYVVMLVYLATVIGSKISRRLLHVSLLGRSGN